MSNVVPLVYFLTKGNVRFDLGVPMLCANMVGGYVGARAAISKGSRFIKWLLFDYGDFDWGEVGGGVLSW